MLDLDKVMATSTPKPEVNEESSGLCCAVCLDQYVDPRSLACLHTFCERCVHDIVMKQKNEKSICNGIECPLCRKFTEVKCKDTPPEMWSKIIPSNFALQDVLETLKADTKVKDTVDKCLTHNKVIEFYCREERTLCCSACALNKVKEGKEVSEISEIAWEENRSLAQPLQKQMHDLSLKVNNVKVLLNKTEEELEMNVDGLQIEMNTLQDKIIEKLEIARGEILSELNVLGKDCINRLQAQRSRCGAAISTLEEATHLLNVAIQYKTPSQLFIDLHKIQSKMNGLQIEVDDQISQTKLMDISFKTSDAMKQFLEVDLKLGELNTKEESLKTESLQDYRKVCFKPMASMTVVASPNDEKQPLYSGMEFLSNGDLIAVDNANWKCEVLGAKLNFKGVHQFSTHVFDVVEVSNGVIYVTGAKRLERVVVDNNGGLTPAGTLGVESCPFSISVLDEEQFVVGTYRTQNPVRIISMAGSESEWSFEFPQKHWKIDSSRCAYDRHNKLLVLSDRFDNCVYIYDTQIRHEVRVKNENIVEPRGVAFGPHNCVFVCSKGTNALVQLSRYGELIGSYPLNIVYPCTICFSPDNKILAVSNSYANDKKLVLFALYGT